MRAEPINSGSFQQQYFALWLLLVTNTGTLMPRQQDEESFAVHLTAEGRSQHAHSVRRYNGSRAIVQGGE